MAYSCAYFEYGPSGSLEAAQQAKLHLVCRKLGLAEGKRHLDVGCGWGSLILHAAKHYGAQSTGVTLSRQQYEFVSKRISDQGLTDRVQVRLADYRELASGLDDDSFDAVSTIEMVSTSAMPNTRRSPKSCSGCSSPAGGRWSSRCQGGTRHPAAGPSSRPTSRLICT